MLPILIALSSLYSQMLFCIILLYRTLGYPDRPYHSLDITRFTETRRNTHVSCWPPRCDCSFVSLSCLTDESLAHSMQCCILGLLLNNPCMYCYGVQLQCTSTIIQILRRVMRDTTANQSRPWRVTRFYWAAVSEAWVFHTTLALVPRRT